MPAVYVDVDAALITGPATEDFVRFWWRCRHGDDTAVVDRLATLRAESARGTDPVALNRLRHALLAGAPYAAVADFARKWFEEYREGPGAFVTSTVQAVARHRTAGDAVVLVSESVPALVEAIAGEFGADGVVCAEPVVDGLGRFTGEISEPLIGAARAAAATRDCAARGFDPAGCCAYGGRWSDVDLLRAVGRPRVVGDHPLLLAAAREGGWPVLAGDAGPAPSPRRLVG